MKIISERHQVIRPEDQEIPVSYSYLPFVKFRYVPAAALLCRLIQCGIAVGVVVLLLPISHQGLHPGVIRDNRAVKWEQSGQRTYENRQPPAISVSGQVAEQVLLR